MLTQALKDNLEISESTLYPVLRRLQKEKYLTTYDEPYQGRNRRYYHITDEGDQMCATYKEEWMKYKSKIDKMIIGGEADE
jgi:PadR family transcriptional regulator PadR